MEITDVKIRRIFETAPLESTVLRAYETAVEELNAAAEPSLHTGH